MTNPVNFLYCIVCRIFLGDRGRVAQWLRCCATNRKVAGSIPAGVIGNFHWHNTSDRTMALGSTQPLTEMSTRSISWGKGSRCVMLTNLPPSCAVVVKSGNLNFLESFGPLQACNGTDLPVGYSLPPWLCVALLHFSHHRFSWSSPSFSITTWSLCRKPKHFDHCVYWTNMSSVTSVGLRVSKQRLKRKITLFLEIQDSLRAESHRTPTTAERENYFLRWQLSHCTPRRT